MKGEQLKFKFEGKEVKRKKKEKNLYYVEIEAWGELYKYFIHAYSIAQAKKLIAIKHNTRIGLKEYAFVKFLNVFKIEKEKKEKNEKYNMA